MFGDDGAALAEYRDPSDGDLDRRLVQDECERLPAALARPLVLPRGEIAWTHADHDRFRVEGHELIPLAFKPRPAAGGLDRPIDRFLIAPGADLPVGREA